MIQARIPVLPLLLAFTALGSACEEALVQFESPASGATISTAQTISLEVSLTATGQEHVEFVGGLDRIEFLVDGVVRCTDTAAPFTCPWSVTSSDNGVHAWHVEIWTNSGHKKPSSASVLNVDIDAPAPTGDPQLVGFIPGVGTALDVAVEGGEVFVASDPFGLSVIAGGRVDAAATSAFRGEHTAVRGSRAVVTGVSESGFSGLWVLDLPAGGWPVVVGELVTTVTPGSSTGFYDVALDASGTLALVAAGQDGVWVIDVSDPAAPVEVGRYDAPEWDSWSFGVAFDASGGRAYLADGGQGLKILDVSNPANPTLLGSRALSGTQRDVAVVGNRAYVVNQSGAMRVVDVSNPAAPVWLGTGGLSGVAVKISAEGTRVAVLSLGSGAVLDVFDTSNPALPARTGTVSVGALEEGKGLALSDGLAYVAAGSGGVKVYDASASTPSLTDAVEDHFLGEHMAADGNLAVVVGEDVTSGMAHLQVLDIASVGEPSLAGELATTISPGSSTGFHGVAFSSLRRLAVVAAGVDGIWVVDVANPALPRIVGSYGTPDRAFGVALDPTGTLAYVADGDSGLAVLDISNPSQPAMVGSRSLSGSLRAVALEGNKAYVVSLTGRLRAVDVSDPSAPVPIGSTTFSGIGLHVAVDGDRAIVLSQPYENDLLNVFDVSNPAQLQRVGSLALAGQGEAGGVDLSGDLAVVAGGNAGLVVVDLSDPSSPQMLDSGAGVGTAHDAVLDGANVCVTGFPASVSILSL